MGTRIALLRQKFDSVEKFLINERTTYILFKNPGHIYHNEDDWNLVYIMQHHGEKRDYLTGPNLLQPRFFTSSSWDDNNYITIRMLNPLKLNKKTLGGSHFYTTQKESYRENIAKDTETPHPIRNIPRIVAQQGVYKSTR